ncbi:MAG: hypothetical protein AAFQ54_00480 [Pseudomonadota bacterium]
MPDDKTDLLAYSRDLEELKLLRQEMALFHGQTFQTELVGFGAIFAYYAWVISVEVSGPQQVWANSALTVPPILATVGVLGRLEAYRHRMARLAVYIALVESRAFLEPGWENFLRMSRGLGPLASLSYDEGTEAERRQAIAVLIADQKGTLWSTWRARLLLWFAVLAFTMVVTGLSVTGFTIISTETSG